jgi:hypothetical protein
MALGDLSNNQTHHIIEEGSNRSLGGSVSLSEKKCSPHHTDTSNTFREVGISEVRWEIGVDVLNAGVGALN